MMGLSAKAAFLIYRANNMQISQWLILFIVWIFVCYGISPENECQ
jgi:hypothetical protein